MLNIADFKSLTVQRYVFVVYTIRVCKPMTWPTYICTAYIHHDEPTCCKRGVIVT